MTPEKIEAIVAALVTGGVALVLPLVLVAAIVWASREKPIPRQSWGEKYD